MEDLKGKKRGRDDSDESGIDSPEVKRLREDLLDSLDDDDSELCTTSQDLDSFMKSFEEEITASPSSAAASAGDGGKEVQVVDLTSDSGESRPDLGFLLEASDDELGLPPTTSSSGGLGSEAVTELVRVGSDSSELGSEFWGMPGYDSFEYGLGETETHYNGEYVAIDGLFDYSDMGFGSGDFPWRPGTETLPAQ